MVNVGVVGLGMMGQTHLDAYSRIDPTAVKVVAVADKDESLLAGKKQVDGTFEGQAEGGYDLSTASKYTDGLELIADPEVQMVDLCLVTPLHVPFAVAALKAGKHVLIEKPLARTSEDAERIIEAEAASDAMAMCAQCMRFWPGWDWLKQAVEERRYGQLLSATFTRLGRPPETPFYRNGELSGGAALDLHIHDTDFVHHLLGVPKSVSSVGYSRISGGVDHLSTQYHYDDVRHVTAEGGWVPQTGLGFTMRYRVIFEHAVALFDLAEQDAPLTLFEQGEEPAQVDLPAGQGYEYEIAYFLSCISRGTPPKRSSLRDAAGSLCILEAEVRSAESGRPEPVRVID